MDDVRVSVDVQEDPGVTEDNPLTQHLNPAQARDDQTTVNNNRSKADKTHRRGQDPDNDETMECPSGDNCDAIDDGVDMVGDKNDRLQANPIDETMMTSRDGQAISIQQRQQQQQLYPGLNHTRYLPFPTNEANFKHFPNLPPNFVPNLPRLPLHLQNQLLSRHAPVSAPTPTAHAPAPVRSSFMISDILGNPDSKERKVGATDPVFVTKHYVDDDDVNLSASDCDNYDNELDVVNDNESSHSDDYPHGE